MAQSIFGLSIYISVTTTIFINNSISLGCTFLAPTYTRNHKHIYWVINIMGKTSKKGPSLHVILDAHGNKLETFTLQSVRKSPGTSPAGRRHCNTMPPKVYIVDPRGFRHLVQKLTGSPRGGAASAAIITSRVKKGGGIFRRPPPIQLPQSPPAVLMMPAGQGSCGSDEQVGALPLLPREVTSTSSSELDMNSSPEGMFEVGEFDFLASLPEVQSPWYNYQVLSPGTLASLEQEASM